MFAGGLAAQEVVRLNGHEFTLAEGMTIELAVDSDLCPRPITASFASLLISRS